MMTLATVVLTCTALGVATILVTGIITFMRGGEVDRRNSLKLMNIRVATQVATLLLLAAVILLTRD